MLLLLKNRPLTIVVNPSTRLELYLYICIYDQVAFEKLSVQKDGKIEFWEFELFHQAFPSLFFPAFRLQVRAPNIGIIVYPVPENISQQGKSIIS